MLQHNDNRYELLLILFIGNEEEECNTLACTEKTNSADNEELDQTEVEIVSLLHDPVPKYKLRSDYLNLHGSYTSFSEDQAGDFIIKTPTLSTEQESQIKGSLTPEQAGAALEYFVLSGNRLSQMTQTYKDVDAVTRLLQVI